MSGMHHTPGSTAELGCVVICPLPQRVFPGRVPAHMLRKHTAWTHHALDRDRETFRKETRTYLDQIVPHVPELEETFLLGANK
jgi:hypothetical protein